MGDRLGLYRALAGAGPLTPARARAPHRHRRALRPRVAERPGGRRLRRVRAPTAAATRCPPEQAVALTDEASPAYLPGFFQIALGSRASTRRGSSRRRAAARASAGTSTTTTSSRAASASSGPATTRNLRLRVAAGARRRRREARARRGRRRRRLRPRRLDDPDGAGVPRPRRFVGFDYHDGSIATARERAADGGRRATASSSTPRRRRRTRATATTS